MANAPISNQSKFWQRIQGKLILLLLVLLIPTLLIKAYIQHDRLQGARAAELQANLELARAVAKSFETFVQDISHHEAVIGIALNPPSQHISLEEQNRILDKCRAVHSFIWNLAWVNPRGIIVAATMRDSIGKDLSDRTHIQKIVAGGDWAISDLILTKVSGDPAFTIARGVRDEQGALLGIVIAVVFPEQLDHILGIKRSQGGGHALVDSKGMLVYRYPAIKVKWEERNWVKDYPEVGEALKGNEVATTVYAPFEGKTRLVGFTPVASFGWAASAGRTEDIAVAAIRASLVPQAVLFSLVTLAAFFIALIYSRPISNSMKRLRDHALALAKGENGNPVIVSGPAELKELANSFNTMSEELQSRERSLREQREWLRVTLTSIGDAVLTTDTKGMVTFLNPVAENLIGWKLDEAKGQPIQSVFRIINEKTKQPTENIVERVLRQGQTVCLANNTALITPDGQEIPIEDSAAPIKDGLGGIIGVVLVFHDVTEKRRAQQSIRENMASLDLALSSAQMGVWHLDIAEGRRVFDEQVCCLLGIDHIQFRGTAEEFFDSVHPEDHGTIHAALTEAIEHGSPYETEYRAVWPDGSIHHISAKGRVSCDDQGQSVRLNGLIWEITERKQAEARQALMTDILRILSSRGDLHSKLADSLELIRKGNDYDAVGLRLRVGDDFPYFVQAGFSEQFIREENFLCERRGDGQIIRDSDGQTVLECTCGLVLSGRTDPSMPCFTESGSFWTNVSKELLSLPKEADPRTNPRNRCIHTGYQSVGLFPIRVGQEIIGLLQLNDNKEGRFTPELIQFYEAFAQNIGLALQRLAAEESLRESEERFRALVTASSDVVYRMSPDWSEMRHLQGRDFIQDTEKPTSTWLNKYIHPDDQPAVIAAINESIRTKSMFELEHRIIRKDGSLGWTFSRAVPLLDGNGDIIEWFGAATDITERRLAEEKIRNQNAILETINLIFQEALTCETDEQLGIACLTALEALTQSQGSFIGEIGPDGLLHDIAMGSTVWESCAMYDKNGHQRPPSDFKVHGLYGHVLLNGESLFINQPYSHQDSIGTPEGHPILTAFLGVPLKRDGKTIGIIVLGNREGGYAREHQAMVEAIAPALVQALLRKRAEEALRRAHSELELRVLERTAELESVNTKLILEIEERKRANEAANTERQRLYHVLETLPVYVCLLTVDYHVSFANRVFRERFGKSKGLRCFEHLFARNEPCEVCDTYKVLKTKTPHHWEWTGPDGRDYSVFDFPFADTDGSTLILEMGIDITEQKRAEAQITTTISRLELINQELQEFAFVASHDLQEPLRKIQSFGDMLMTRCGAALGEQGKDYLMRMENAASRMRQLIQDLLNYSRVATKLEPYKSVNLNEVLSEVIQIFEHRCAKGDAVIEVSDMPIIDADELQMKQLFQNLIGNAFKYRKQNEFLKVKVYKANQNNDYCQIFVEDNGIGFEEEFADKIFAPFQRLHTKEDYDGTGMGLAICRKIIERHGGSIIAQSEPGKGSTFIINLPIRR